MRARACRRGPGAAVRGAWKGVSALDADGLSLAPPPASRCSRNCWRIAVRNSSRPGLHARDGSTGRATPLRSGQLAHPLRAPASSKATEREPIRARSGRSASPARRCLGIGAEVELVAVPTRGRGGARFGRACGWRSQARSADARALGGATALRPRRRIAAHPGFRSLGLEFLVRGALDKGGMGSVTSRGPGTISSGGD